MNLNEAERYLYSFTDYEKTPGIAYSAANYDLKRMELLLASLGNPQIEIKTVHIAGTKGKGSTAAMIASILTAGGFKTGLYTSPHLHDIRERIRIKGKLISEKEFAGLVSEVKPLVDKINCESAFGKLTTFELLTSLALTYFGRNKVDFQVIETGMGGRLDATNVLHGDVCVITSISLDHTEILGNTEAKIAIEKAGIIKTGSTVISFKQKEEVNRIIEQTCEQKNSRLIYLGKEVTWERKEGDYSGQTLVVNSGGQSLFVTIPLIGDVQLENAAAAVTAVRAISRLGISIPEKAIIGGLANVAWPGRLQILRKNPTVIADGAHNADSMKKLIESLQKYFDYERCRVIFGCSSDKDVEGMANELVQVASNITVTTSTHPRAADQKTLAENFKKQGIDVIQAESVGFALENELKASGKNDLILVTGSLFIVAEAIRYFELARL